ncbi:MAG: FAD-binding oxidoreductase [SAR202 cluster bacterium]|nr:FAD-binding oxidoreductase [SAR202 cluster bacterium]
MASAGAALASRFGMKLTGQAPPRLQDVKLRRPRLKPPATLAEFCATGKFERALHSCGHSFPDRVSKFRGEFATPPDVVAFPRTEDEAVAALDWAYSSGAAVIPYGGGSSVVGGVTPPAEAERVVTIDLTGLNRVLEVDRVSRAARIQAGVLGPDLEAQLKAHQLTLRHFPQSFEFSTLGGWIVTRSAGHYATNRTHIDEFVESIRMITPKGIWESRRLPGSGAGPDPNRIVCGSEGTLGLVTEAWVRLQAKPRFRESAGVAFAGLAPAAEAARRIVQANLWPANCRVLDPGESATNAGLTGAQALLVIGFESSEVPQASLMRDALDIAMETGGKIVDRAGDSVPGPVAPGPVDRWRTSFIQMPYRWNELLGFGLINDTFESAITWDRWPDFDKAVRAKLGRAMREVAGKGDLNCRFTHVYPDGPAPYYSFTCPGRPGSEVGMWQEIKAAASEAIIAAGGTITHHHAVGRDHVAGYEQEAPELFRAAFRSMKSSLDPSELLNPGVLSGSR